MSGHGRSQHVQKSYVLGYRITHDMRIFVPNERSMIGRQVPIIRDYRRNGKAGNKYLYQQPILATHQSQRRSSRSDDNKTLQLTSIEHHRNCTLTVITLKSNEVSLHVRVLSW